MMLLYTAVLALFAVIYFDSLNEKKQLEFEYGTIIERIRADYADERVALQRQLRLANEECNHLAGKVVELEGQLESARRMEIGGIVGMLPNARRVMPNGRPPCE